MNRPGDENDALHGSLDAARKRLLRLAELAAVELDDAGELNAVNTGLIARLCDKRGSRDLLDEMRSELRGEGVSHSKAG